jgi:hypothetical protein
MRKARNRSIIIMPIFLGWLVTTSIDIMIDKSILERDWNSISTWIIGLSIGTTIILLFIDFDVDRFLLKFFRTEEVYQQFLLVISIGIAFLAFAALTLRWYGRNGSNFSM